MGSFLTFHHNLITNMSTKIPVTKCLTNIEHALINHDLYQATYGDVLKLPIVVQYTNTIKKLRKEIKIMTKKEKKRNSEILRNKSIIQRLLDIIKKNNKENPSEKDKIYYENCVKGDEYNVDDVKQEQEKEGERDDVDEKDDDVDVGKEDGDEDGDEYEDNGQEDGEVDGEEDEDEDEDNGQEDGDEYEDNGQEDGEVEVEEDGDEDNGDEEVDGDEDEEKEEEKDEEKEEKKESETTKDEEDELELEEVIVGDIEYYTTNKIDGDIYEKLSDESVGEIIGKYIDGIASINIQSSENVNADTDVDVEEVEIKGVTYYATNIIDGEIYLKLPDESVGDDVIGNYKKGIAFFL